jgi:hypothetical protein
MTISQYPGTKTFALLFFERGCMLSYYFVGKIMNKNLRRGQKVAALAFLIDFPL